MPSDRPNQTLADYVALAISPALLMGLVASLVFFLLEVLYPAQGEYKDRLQYILFFFVFGAVLVGRISMTQGIAGRAGLYGIVLAGLTWIGMQIYVDYTQAGSVAPFSPLINFFLVGLVWWCSHRLTWDCTQIDEETEVEGEGLLQATGLEKSAAVAAKPEEAPAEPGMKELSPGFLIEWWERYQRFREQRKKRRVLGAWVVYFSLAALPLFGLGEALIPAEESGRRQYAFWLMCAYVASGLGLLVTTCFLSVRRYLRQRRIQMPAAMTAVWLSAGGGMILLLLVIGALLPRPRPEYSFLPSSLANSDKLSASQLAAQGGSSGKDQGRRIGDPPKDKGDPSARDKDSQAADKDKGDPAQDKDKGGANDKDKDGAGKGPDKDKDGSDKDKGDSRDKNGDAANQPKDKPPSNPPKDGPQQRDKAAAAQKDSPSKSSGSQPASNPGSSWDWSSALATVAVILKWIVFGLLILAVIFFLLREGLKFLSNFTDWAKNLLNALRYLWVNLFQRGTTEAKQDSGAAETTDRRAPAAPFSSFANPFRDGRADRRPIKELVSYTFAALEAWARERHVERLPDETPLEFAKRLGAEFPALETEARRFVLLYARSVYDYEPLPGNTSDVVRQFWKRLETAAEQPLSV